MSDPWLGKAVLTDRVQLTNICLVSCAAPHEVCRKENNTGTTDPVPERRAGTVAIGGAHGKWIALEGLGPATAAVAKRGTGTVNAVGPPPGSSLGVGTPQEIHPVPVIMITR